MLLLSFVPLRKIYQSEWSVCSAITFHVKYISGQSSHPFAYSHDARSFQLNFLSFHFISFCWWCPGNNRWESRHQYSSHWWWHQATTNSIQWRSNLSECKYFIFFWFDGWCPNMTFIFLDLVIEMVWWYKRWT